MRLKNISYDIVKYGSFIPGSERVVVGKSVDSYECEGNPEIFDALLIHGDLARFTELLPQETEEVG